MSRFSALGASPVGLRQRRGRSRPGRRAARIFGSIVLGAGLLTLGVIGVQLLRGTVARERARAEWTKIMASSDISAIAAMTQMRVASGKPVVRVVIPSIRLDEVVVEGLSDKDLWAGPGHMPGTVFPGQNGNSVVSAHRDRHFHRLDDVRVGDMIETQTPQLSVMWRVTLRRVVLREERVIFETPDPVLTLTTCWPTRYLGPAPERLILTAVPVSMRERGVTASAVDRETAAR
ncbi:MAG TPA: class D sortase [Gemmatimonadaceae bacterium]|nr:class D sortase [Gemmatimonadaceae bacterium]